MCLDCACGAADRPAPPLAPSPAGPSSSPAKTSAATLTVNLGLKLLARNDQQAATNRARFRAAGVRAVNLLSSPGSGKTALLEALAHTAQGGGGSDQPAPALAVLVGDLATDRDAQRLRAAGLPAVQITTGDACHLDGAMVHRGTDALEASGHPLQDLDLLLIENVGNLVCPASYDLGEALRVVLLAVTEGEDKPLKYPAAFASADLVVISKTDLAAAAGFERSKAWAHIRQMAPAATILEVSARDGTGLDLLLKTLLAAGAEHRRDRAIVPT